METLDFRTISKILSSQALGGRKIPHRVSNPVFRIGEDGSVKAAAFIYTYTAEQLKALCVPRPKRWIEIDLKTQAVTEYSCEEKEFSDLAADSMCDLSPEITEKFSREYSKQTIAIFDLILRKYLLTSVFDKQLDKTCFQRFYKALP